MKNAPTYSPEELALLANVRAMTPRRRRTVYTFVEALSGLSPDSSNVEQPTKLALRLVVNNDAMPA